MAEGKRPWRVWLSTGTAWYAVSGIACVTEDAAVKAARKRYPDNRDFMLQRVGVGHIGGPIQYIEKYVQEQTND